MAGRPVSSESHADTSFTLFTTFTIFPMTTAEAQHHRRTLRGIVLTMSAVFMFSAMDTLAKYMLKSYPMSALMWARYVVHIVVMLALLWPRMGMKLIRTSHPWLQILRGVLLVGSTTFFYFALRYLPLAEAAAISFVGPVLTALLSGPMLGDKVTRRQWFAVTLGFVGVLIIMRPGGGVLSLAAVFPLATAILFSVYQIVTRGAHIPSPRRSIPPSSAVRSPVLLCRCIGSRQL